MSEVKTPVYRLLPALKVRKNLFAQVVASLEGGEIPEWDEAHRVIYTSMMQKLGFTVLTEGQLRAKGLTLTPDARPVATAYYGPPKASKVELYIRECHCIGEEVEEVIDLPEPQPAFEERPPAKRKKGGCIPKVKIEVVVDTAEAARHCGKTIKSMQNMRHHQKGPEFHREGNKCMYKVSDLDAWLAEQAG